MDELYGIHSSAAADTYSEKGLFSSPADQYNQFYDHYHSRAPELGLESAYSINFQINRQRDHDQDDDDDEQAAASSVIKAKIASHPYYPKLLDAYIDCQKVGAPPEIAYLLDEIKKDFSRQDNAVSMCLGVDPELDEFMETYCDVLVKSKTDLLRPFDEATSFINKIEAQFANLCKLDDGVQLSEEEDEYFSGDETESQDPQMKIEEKELKERLLRKYGGHISNLKLEFSKKKKKGKLPKEARQTLLKWWNVHYKWPYPTEADKISLAELTGLDQKQINNWFINQRKRHWRPSEDMQLAMFDNLSGPHLD